ncbi:family 16 glycosylhydrolase [Psychrosphaera sp. 1_MG-2023]|uniref:family 16 glycosylhydrolase n=1 Tax=Psychrosphaera sp. 1_MG-2023 TaxID=3062643 RepID=UPI0026E3F006|nr:family 16 glycosylhydrolase [Psychrosphaera sp. 1_MG-2023]MDO6719923.1 family 16 glycosylhydrolase [Psychrosphaera sp. 1_MG-2023]
MKNRLFCYLIITANLMAMASCSTATKQTFEHAQPQNKGQTTPLPTLKNTDNTNWQYVASLSDEFNSTKVDEGKWTNSPEGWGPWSWTKDNVTVEDGNLNIALTYEKHQAVRRAYKDGGRKVTTDLFYKSGIIRSHEYQTYGYYEARMKGIPTFPGSSPAFWIYSLNDEISKMGLKGKHEGEATYSEVDIVELQQAEWDKNAPLGYDGANVIDMNLHTRIIENGKEIWKRPGKYPELTRNKIHADFDARDDFHIYGAEVTPEVIRWFIDGVQVAEKPNLHWHLPMHVTLSLGLRYPHVSYNNCPNGFVRCTVPEKATAEGYPSAMQVDWVRVYKKK